MLQRSRLVVLFAAFAAAATADDDDGDGPPGFQTSQQAMLTCTGCRTGGVIPILSVGDTPPNGYTFEAIPDGISLIGGGGGDDDDDDDDFRLRGSDDDDDDDGGRAEILINHELSLVPFPGTRQDPSNSIVGRIQLNGDAEVVRSSVAIPSSAGYQRFCSNFLVDREHGFRRPLLFTNEEARDLVLRQEESWRATPADRSRPAGSGAGRRRGRLRRQERLVQVDLRHGPAQPRELGRPAGLGRPVILSGDDTFDAPASQLYMYTAQSGQDVWDDKGKLYAFVSDNAGDQRLRRRHGRHDGDRALHRGSAGDRNRQGRRRRQRGHLGRLRLPDAGRRGAADAAMPDGPQWVLEHWSNLNNVFQFIRIEDTAYDRRNSRIMYMADTGEPRAIPHAERAALQRGASSTVGSYMNGRLWKLELGRDPLVGAKLSILPNANFDLNGYANANSPHQPDNMETTRNAIYFQEDPGAHNSSNPPTTAAFPPFPNATNARIWRYDLRTGALRVIAEVNQTVPGAPTTLAKGTWESSGIVDASSEFGRGAFLVDIQAHQWDVPTNSHPGQNRQREQGQLLLIKVRDP